MSASVDGSLLRSDPWEFRIGLVTDPGRRRERNEDAMAALVPYGDVPASGRSDAFFLVADGMGGHDAGDVASDFVARRVRAWFGEEGSDDPRTPFEDQLETLLLETNQALVAFGRSEGLATGAGSTATLGCIRGDLLHIAHVGDSRLYRLRAGELEQLTQDHSWVEEQRRAGILDDSEIADHPARHMLTECLGVGPDLRVFTRLDRIEHGDRLLLCTDGLHGPVSDADLKQVLAGEPDPQVAARILVSTANDRSGPDNITAVVVDVIARHTPDPLGRTQPLPAVTGVEGREAGRPAPTSRLSGALMAAGVLALLAAAFVGERSTRSAGATDADPDAAAVETPTLPIQEPPSTQSVPAEDGSMISPGRTDGERES